MINFGQQDMSEDHNSSKDNDVKQQPSRIYQQLFLQLFSGKVFSNYSIDFSIKALTSYLVLSCTRVASVEIFDPAMNILLITQNQHD